MFPPDRIFIPASRLCSADGRSARVQVNREEFPRWSPRDVTSCFCLSLKLKGGVRWVGRGEAETVLLVVQMLLLHVT